MDLTQIALYTVLVILIYIIYMMRVFVSVERRMLTIDQNIEHMVNHLADELLVEEVEESWEDIVRDIRPPKKFVVPVVGGRKKITYPNLKRTIEPHHYFVLKSGRVLKDINELVGALRNMSNEDFEHHVTPEKNDFADWVRHVYEEGDLADKISIKDDKRDIKRLLEKAHKKQ